jgi:hypothetical protein
MPYIRLYSQPLSLPSKRSIAQKLISITERTFHLRPEECGNINVQFLPPASRDLRDLDESRLESNETADVLVEVSDRYLTPEKITAFVEASAPMLTSSVLTTESRRFARMLGLEAETCLQIAFEFKVSGAAYRNADGWSGDVMPERKAA